MFIRLATVFKTKQKFNFFVLWRKILSNFVILIYLKYLNAVILKYQIGRYLQNKQRGLEQLIQID